MRESKSRGRRREGRSKASWGRKKKNWKFVCKGTSCIALGVWVGCSGLWNTYWSVPEKTTSTVLVDWKCLGEEEAGYEEQLQKEEQKRGKLRGEKNAP